VEVTSARAQLLQRAKNYVEANDDFDPSDPGLYWGDALCDLLGGADYGTFAIAQTDDGATICAVPQFGEMVSMEQFTPEEFEAMMTVSEELTDLVGPLTQTAEPGTDEWVVGLGLTQLAPSMRTPGLGPKEKSAQGLMVALGTAAFWLLNAQHGLLDLTGSKRPWSE